MLAVHKAHERGMDAVSEQPLNVLAALLHRLARWREAVVILGAAPGRAALGRHTEAGGERGAPNRVRETTAT